LSKEKGCDASNFYDEELKNNDCFSDDEQENNFKKKNGVDPKCDNEEGKNSNRN